MTLNIFLLGATAVTCLLIAVVFLRFWRTTRDRFFLLFATSFLIEAVSRVALALMPLSSEQEPIFYSVRLVVFMIIAYAIIDKNLALGRFKKPRVDTEAMDD